MTNLTEQWKQGKLQGVWYYIKVIPDFEYSNDIAFYTGGYFELYSEQDIEQVLAPVPTYEEYQALLSDQLAKNEAVEINAELEAENKKLKELMKECKQWFDWYHIDTGTGKEYIESWHKKGHEIHKKINEVLK